MTQPHKKKRKEGSSLSLYETKFHKCYACPYTDFILDFASIMRLFQIFSMQDTAWIFFSPDNVHTSCYFFGPLRSMKRLQFLTHNATNSHFCRVLTPTLLVYFHTSLLTHSTCVVKNILLPVANFSCMATTKHCWQSSKWPRKCCLNCRL